MVKIKYFNLMPLDPPSQHFLLLDTNETTDQIILVIAMREAGPCERRPNSRATFSEDAQMRVRKQLLAAKKPNGKKTE